MSSSIADAFQKALSKTQTHLSPLPAEWDDEGEAAPIETTSTKPQEQHAMQQPHQYFKTTNNVTRATFDHVRNNPGLTRVEAAKALEAQGFKRNSTASLLTQMVRQELLRESNGLLYANKSEYSPLKASLRRKQAAEKEVPQPAPKAAKPAAQAPVNVSPQEAFDAEKIVEHLTPKQARAVYDYLRELFA